jgi:phosphoribosylformylglycinamidine cyclo-ligase
LGEVLLTPTRIYAKQILALAADLPIKGIAHITGGGITENLPRILPENCRARLDRGMWPAPPIFRVLRTMGNLDEEEMYRVFNMGIGLVLVTAVEHADKLMTAAFKLGDHGYRIGKIVHGKVGVEYVGNPSW